MLARTSLDTPQSCHEIHLTSTHISFVRFLRYFSLSSSARREGSTTYTEWFNDVLSSPLVLSVFCLYTWSRVFVPKTEHESFFWVADLVYAAGDSARNKKKRAALGVLSTCRTPKPATRRQLRAAWVSIFLFRQKLLIMNYSSRKLRTEAHGAHKYRRVANFGVGQVLTTPKMQKTFHGHVGTR